ncbi:hypothetical protein DTO012A9_2386 [Penicillium roqueforti]|nr:hypothetical protein CBS147310_3025 [Penicillium roqueforti]KAI3263172.1 hypothetical protein DTO012A9_2386 [Penicillium roqueforti]
MARERRPEALVFVDEEVELVNDDAVQAVLLVQLVDKGGEGMGFGALWGDEDDRVPRRGVVNVPDFGAQVETPVAGQEVLLECDIRHHHDGRPELGDGEGELEQQGLATGGGKHGHDRLVPGLQLLEDPELPGAQASVPPAREGAEGVVEVSLLEKALAGAGELPGLDFAQRAVAALVPNQIPKLEKRDPPSEFGGTEDIHQPFLGLVYDVVFSDRVDKIVRGNSHLSQSADDINIHAQNVAELHPRGQFIQIIEAGRRRSFERAVHLVHQQAVFTHQPFINRHEWSLR